jgi:hypothetical protein
VARKSLRPQLNQIRAWVRQGRTDAWIAHQLGVPASQLRDFRSRHGLDEGEEPASDVDLRDEIEAEIEAELSEPEPEEEEGTTDEDEDADDEGEGEGEGDRDSDEGDGGEGAGGRRRRRRRRGRRGRGRRRPLEATFDQGEKDGYGIWLDASVKDDPTYTEHWQGHKALKVTIEPERIVLERVED